MPYQLAYNAATDITALLARRSNSSGRRSRTASGSSFSSVFRSSLIRPRLPPGLESLLPSGVSGAASFPSGGAGAVNVVYQYIADLQAQLTARKEYLAAQMRQQG